MRTSNKIILATFLTPLIVFTAINLSLYAKYKSGNYVVMKTVVEDRFTRIALKNTTTIAVHGLNNFNIIQADSVQLEMEKQQDGHLRYSINGDSLVIHGDTTVVRSNGTNEVQRSYQQVNLYLPGGANITVDNCDLSLQGSKDSLKAASWNFTFLQSAGFRIQGSKDEKGDPVYFRELFMHSGNSGIELTASSHVADLRLFLKQTEFIDNDAYIEKLTIDADKSSKITLKGDNLGRMNMAH